MLTLAETHQTMQANSKLQFTGKANIRWEQFARTILYGSESIPNCSNYYTWFGFDNSLSLNCFLNAEFYLCKTNRSIILIINLILV